MKSEPGTYVLLLYCRIRAEAEIGRLGNLVIKPGYYIYVGSAFGPGGLLARVRRHYSNTKSKHWHIDYLLDFVKPVNVWYSYEPVKLEHEWARILSGMKHMISVKGFGCSDCSCNSHLFRSKVKPDFECFSAEAGGNVHLYRSPNH